MQTDKDRSSTSHTNPKNSDTMATPIARYLIASLILDKSFRQRVLNLANEETKSLAPELGIDLEKLVRISSLLESREWKYSRNIGLLSIGAAILLIASIDSEVLPLVLIVSLILIAVIIMRKYLEQNQKITPLLANKKYHNLTQLEQYLTSNFKTELPERSLPSQDQNLVVYSGFVPFVGSGVDLGGWSFPINISRPMEEIEITKEIQPFELSDLYSFIDVEMSKCDFEGFESQDYLFVNGTQIRGTEWILPDIAQPPVLNVDEDKMKQYLNNSDPLIRHYKWMRMMDWNSELILSYFLRCSIRGEYLFIEVNRFLLPPLDEQYRKIDHIQRPDGLIEEIVGFISLFIFSVIISPFIAISSVFTLIGKIIEYVNKINPNWKKRRRRKAIAKKSDLDYGADTSLRNDISSDAFKHYFQKLDKEMYVKVFEKQLLDSITEFLEVHNIDVSDIKERKNTVLNTGIIMQGGELKADSLAVGAEAKSSVVQQVGQRFRGRSSTES